MAPSELTHALTVFDERLKTAYTVALSLVTFAIAAVVAVFAVQGIARPRRRERRPRRDRRRAARSSPRA